MTNNNEAFEPTPEWPLQAEYKERYHKQLQGWARAIVPRLELEEGSEDKEAFLEHLVTSVLRGDPGTMYLLKALDTDIRESFRSWYSDELGYVSQDMMADQRMAHFNTLYALYIAGRESG